jgi:phospholipase/carboxylesterase
LRYRESLGGVLALSTYLPLRDRLASEASEANRTVPILMCHGRNDPVLSIQLGRLSRDALQALGYAVEWKEYGMQHEVCAEEIADIARWLRRRLP